MFFMEGLWKQEAESRRLQELRKQFTTAEDVGANECQKCGYCCHKRTCIPTPDELKKIAEFLGLSVIDAIKQYFCVDTQRYDYYWVKPLGANRLDRGGQLLDADETFDEGKCVFLTDDNLCRIHDVKPASAKAQRCWMESGGATGWDGWKNGELDELYPREEWE
jgi:Fe-S-cluster containining protein